MRAASDAWAPRAAALALAAALSAAPAFAADEEAKAQAAADAAAMQAVCGRCHSLQLVTSQPRSETEWMGILQKMADLGARGTDEQFDGVVRYLRAHLTAVNVNSAPADELARLLDLPQAVADSIVARRDRQKFRDLADLETVSGVDRGVLEARKGRILF